MTAEFVSGLIGHIDPNEGPPRLLIQHRRPSRQMKSAKWPSIKKVDENKISKDQRNEENPSSNTIFLVAPNVKTESSKSKKFKKSIRERMSIILRKKHSDGGQPAQPGLQPGSIGWNLKLPGGVVGVYDISRLFVSKVYNKLKPEDPDKVVDIESQEEQIGYEFSTTQINEFRKVFNAFDRDGNNSIGTEELGPVLCALGYSPSDSDIQKVLSRFDADHSGDLSFEEYLALMAVWVEEDETQIIEAFKVFDKSGDGFVTISELKRALCRFGEKFTEEEADEFFASIDVNKDGIINYEEFVKYMLSEINRGPPPRAVKT